MAAKVFLGLVARVRVGLWLVQKCGENPYAYAAKLCKGKFPEQTWPLFMNHPFNAMQKD